ncbi:hypothetical protein [Sphingomonas montanisoli]|uniref:Uncharacterized protein n=1 Tax=Sphingomonas montanisoli TaxID=2606412 RepID=A0A5D9CBB0_9SPHN|nr:hypothetical protein [Sphingomonas montanisoli]TZG29024.1 hypothetical protein FYJ91_02480 [Sphingomonas montanisoli]
MNISERSAIERIARVLAGERISANAHGDQPSAARAVDAAWPDYREDAIAVLRTLREPDAEMAKAGDPLIWEAMVRAALGERPAR